MADSARTGSALMRSMPRRIRIVRPAEPGFLVSADVFDDLFARHIGATCDLYRPPFLAWCRDICGPSLAENGKLDPAAHHSFARLLRGVDFLCPGYHCLAVTPLLMWLRNRAAVRTRFLIIAHAPGAFVLEWSLLRTLVRQGDIIVAPSQSAADVIEMLCPTLGAFTTAIPHPVDRLPATPRRRPDLVVSLSRVAPDKLLHRLVDAVAVLRDQGTSLPPVRIAGPLTLPGTDRTSNYARALAARIRRLKLQEHVALVGAVHGRSERGTFLGRAKVAVCLSVSIEESFCKSAAEALALGIPVLATAWDGLPEVIGGGGHCLALADNGEAFDVSAEVVAARLAGLLSRPFVSGQLEGAASRFHPEAVAAAYQAALTAAREEVEVGTAAGAAGEEQDLGLVARIAPLAGYSWDELFELHLSEVARFLRAVGGAPPGPPCDAEELRAMTLAAVRRPIELMLAGRSAADVRKQSVGACSAGACGASSGLHRGSVAQRVLDAARAGASSGSVIACLEFLAAQERSEEVDHALSEGLACLDQTSPPSAAHDRLRLEVKVRQRKDRDALLDLLRMSVENDGISTPSLRQLARACRFVGLPEVAAPRLCEWLERHPDDPGSGHVWWELYRALGEGDLAKSALAETALRSARTLLG